jgi:single-stranded-DNA-specific exonuclease
MGEDGQHSRFTLVGGGGSARAVAFRTAARLLPATADDRYDAAVRLELNEWNGTVEPRVLLRALCPSESGDARPAVEPPFWDAFWRAYDEPLPEPVPGPALRELRDHRGRGFAGVCGDLMSSGESVLVVCADGPRRRAGLAAVLGGVGVPVAFASWDDVVFEPALAERYAHVVVLDPPSWPRGADWLAGLGPSGFVHLAWGPAEVDFSLAVAERRLDPRDELVLLYRALRAGGGVEAALRDGGRSPQQAARLVRILDEAGLAQVRREDAGLGIELMRVGRTELTKSALYRALLERLDVARRELRRVVPRAA